MCFSTFPIAAMVEMERRGASMSCISLIAPEPAALGFKGFCKTVPLGCFDVETVHLNLPEGFTALT
jgi:hypothetical protein